MHVFLLHLRALPSCRGAEHDCRCQESPAFATGCRRASNMRYSLGPRTYPKCPLGCKCPDYGSPASLGGPACSTLPHRQGDDIVVLIRGLPHRVPASLNGGNEGPLDKASLVPVATSEWTESPLCVGALCPPSLTLTGRANKQLIEPGEGPGRQQCPPAGQGSELSWGWGLPWRLEGDDLSLGRVGSCDRLT